MGPVCNVMSIYNTMRSIQLDALLLPIIIIITSNITICHCIIGLGTCEVVVACSWITPSGLENRLTTDNKYVILSLSFGQ